MSTIPSEPSFRVALTQEERELYSRLFKALDPEGSGIVTGEKARTTFEKSGLPANILGEIWQLSDAKNLGFLTQFGFCHAMRLIGYTQAGQYPTATLAETPGPLPKFADGSFLSQPLRSQSTSGYLLQAQPSAVIPQNTATQASSPQDPLAPVSPADYEKFAQIYVKTTGSRMASLDGNTAKSILMKAKLPTATLGQIWGLVDVNNRGFLDLPSFVMAMHLIHGLLSGTMKQLPPFLPEYVWKSVDKPIVPADRQVSYSSINSQSSTVRHPTGPPPVSRNEPAAASALSEWSVTPLQRQQYDSIFESLDKAKTGSLQAEQVASFLMTSRLDQQDLATIWDLADIQNTGVFSRLEFGIALFLINRRRSGLPLPDVVSEELITSLSTGAQTQSAPVPVSAPAPAPLATPQPPAQPKSSYDELADIFGGSGVPSVQATALSHSSPQTTGIQARASSSDLSHPRDVPKLRQHLTSSFKPSSTFGQSLLGATRTQSATEHADLIGGDVKTEPASSTPSYEASPAEEARISKEAEVQQRPVDYEALRSVPAPPQARSVYPVAEPNQTNTQKSGGMSRDVPSQVNNDLLADSEVSGKLSEATSDIANFSNQIKSLSTQTSNLHEKKIRAEKELTRVLTIKEEINTKLKSLRTSYASEVKQVEHVELNLANAKEELEALRSEASIAEAKLNNISNDFHEKQLAVEETQKLNSTLREKLGNFNAEIAALESEHQSKAAENVRLSNEANVKKSQAQVALVKIDELKSKIAEVESSSFNYSNEISKFEEQKAAAELQARELGTKHEKSTKNLGELQSKHSLLSAGVGAAAGLAAGVGLHSLTKSKKEEKGTALADGNQQDVTELSKAVKTPETLPDGVFPPKDFSQNDNENTQPVNVAPIVDEVKQHPAEGLTGLDDVKDIESHATPLGDGDAESLKERFPEMPVSFGDQVDSSHQYSSAQFDDAKRISTSSAASGSYRHTEGGEVGETPLTTPSNSEYRFSSSNAGVVGGMVGMPGVLVGVQRTDSLTSSVQNNPSMSVRDDNIDEMSDRDTLDDNATFPESSVKDIKHTDNRHEESSEGERLSSGVESFELVNAEELKGMERTRSPTLGRAGSTHPLSQSYRASELSSRSDSQQVEEFPAPKELDYDESSSDESEINHAVGDQFDDANDKFMAQAQKQPSYEFDADFNDLKEAAVENDAGQDEFFDEDFDNLKLADDDFDLQNEVNEPEVSMDDHFTGANDFGGSVHQSTVPDFTQAPSGGADDNDEWEQLFAGFGNAPPAKVPSGAAGANSSHDLAVQELVAMGFDKATVVEALEREDYNVEAATNYLLDHA